MRVRLRAEVGRGDGVIESMAMRKKIGTCVTIAGAICALGVRGAESTPKEALLVLSKGDHTVAIVNPANLQVVARMPSGPDPHEVIADAEGRIAYISNYGGGTLHTLTMADLREQKGLGTFDLGALRGPHGLAFAGGKLWLTVEGSKAVARYDPDARKIDWVMGTGQNRTHMIYVFAGLKKFVTSNVASGTVTIADEVTVGKPPHEDWDETVVETGIGSEGFDVSPDGREIWVAAASDGKISVIDVAAKKVVQVMDANVEGANRLKFTTDGKRVLVSSLRLPDVAVFDAATRREVKRVRVGHGAAGMEMDPDGKRAFVSCTPDDYVAVIDLQTLQVTGHVQAGKGPDGLAWIVEK